MTAAPLDAGPGSHEEVGVLASYKRAWGSLWSHFGILLGVVIVAFLINSPPSIFQGVMGAGGPTTPPDPGQIGTIIGLTWGYGLLIGAPVGFGLFYTFLVAVRDDGPELSNLFEGFRTYPSTLGATVLTGLITFVGFLLLVIPGIVAAIRLSFVPFLVTDEKLGAVDAIKESWNRTSGHGWSLFGLFLLSIPIAFVGVLLLIVGVIPAIMWIYATIATYFDQVSAGPEATVGGTASGTTTKPSGI